MRQRRREGARQGLAARRSAVAPPSGTPSQGRSRGCGSGAHGRRRDQVLLLNGLGTVQANNTVTVRSRVALCLCGRRQWQGRTRHLKVGQIEDGQALVAQGRSFISLKARRFCRRSDCQIATAARKVEAARLFLQASQDVNIGRTALAHPIPVRAAGRRPVARRRGSLGLPRAAHGLTLPGA